MTESASALPKWLPWATTILCLIGLGLAVYLTIAHYSQPEILACPEKGIINCTKVTTSSYASIIGIPVALLGLLFFVGLTPLMLPWTWKQTWKPLIWGRLAMAGSGILMILWLIYVELFKLSAICAYCTAVHVVTFLVFALTAYGTAVLLDEQPAA
jgi:uncharacterized membrane protein